jgi:hypothetical protein
MMSATNAKQPCDKSDKSTCDYNSTRRPRYFHGKLLDDKDFRAEQNYHAGKRRLLNRTLHGSGVVCGLNLSWKKGAAWLDVSPGLALDHEGNEIWVETSERVDLTKMLPPADATAQPPCPPPDTGATGTYYVAICYKEAPTDPVPVYLPGSTCDNKSTCEYSADKEGYCIKLVSECPTGTQKPPDGVLKQLCKAGGCPPEEKPQSDCHNCGNLTGDALCRCYVLEEYCEQSVPCPDMGPCGQSRCVILGRIDLDSKGNVLNVCINECREYVISGRFLKYLISSTLGGAGDIFHVDNPAKTPLLDGAAIARNPIEGLCFLLRYLAVEQNGIVAEGCPIFAGGVSGGNAPVTQKDITDIRNTVATDDATTKATVSRVDKIEATFTPVLAQVKQQQDQAATFQKQLETMTGQVADISKSTPLIQDLQKRLALVEKKIQG